MSAAGVLFVASSTGRVLLALRSPYVRAPNCWSVVGGTINDGEKPHEAALREAHEEIGYTGPVVLIPSLLYTRPPRFAYHNFIGLVPTEFKPKLNAEHLTARWFDLGALPAPMHHGTVMLFEEAASQIVRAAAGDQP